jgi:hypothetical protein
MPATSPRAMVVATVTSLFPLALLLLLSSFSAAFAFSPAYSRASSLAMCSNDSSSIFKHYKVRVSLLQLIQSCSYIVCQYEVVLSAAALAAMPLLKLVSYQWYAMLAAKVCPCCHRCISEAQFRCICTMRTSTHLAPSASLAILLSFLSPSTDTQRSCRA